VGYCRVEPRPLIVIKCVAIRERVGQTRTTDLA
jgi:hypothetical protein